MLARRRFDMKKLLYILLLVMLPEMVVAREYVGTLYVGESLKMENIRVEFVAAKSGMVVVKMYGVKFSKWMPVRVDVEIRNVKDEGGVLTLDYGVPMMNGKVYEKRKVRNLSGKYDGKSVSLRMKLGKSDVRFNGVYK